jgi:hypothetical protein
VLGLALACSTPRYRFVPDPSDHCQNGLLDSALGESDVDCGGTDCHGCAEAQACSLETDCSEGECIAGVCQQPGCDNHALDGDETGVDCGGSCAPCRDGLPCLVASDCDSEVCGEDGSCLTATCTDGVRNGEELDVDCGGSFCDGCGIGAPCVVPADCQSGSCDDATKTCALNCTRGSAECDGDYDDPCETNVLTSSENCGECGHACELSHADSSCVGGTCQIDACVAPWIRCTSDGGAGCEVNASTDRLNCGGCGVVCPDLHGKSSCVDARCAIECDDGFGDCDGDPLTGCEASTNDVDNCGKCGHACPDDDGVPNCVNGKCGVSACEPGTGDCDNDQVCETDLGNDSDNCGRCGNICSARNGMTRCDGGACVIERCLDGWANCDGTSKDGGFANGCETNLATAVDNCGACGTRCDTVAHGSGTCAAGACVVDCDAGFADCDGKAVNGCETDTTSDPNHCGGCDNACDIPNAAAACSASSCVIAHCDANHDDCTGGAGCETDTSSSVQHCGSCTGICSNAGATDVSCTGGECDPPDCDANHRNCDAKNENGCETDVTTAAACGACGNACAGATPNCVATGATHACQARLTLASSAPYPVAQAAAGSLSFNATPRAGTNRLVLLALVSDSITNNASNGLAGSRPGSVTFGSQSMTAGPSQAGTNDAYSPDLFVYYLPLGDAAADQAAVTVTITGSSGPANYVVAQALQLNGAQQSAPITGYAGGFVGTPDPNDPGVTAPTLPVAVSGSLIYSFLADYWDTRACTAGTASSQCPAWSVTPSANVALIETMASAPLTFYPPGTGSAPMRAFGTVVTGSSPSLPAPGNYVPGFSDPNPGRMTYLSVVVAPAQAP